MYDSLKEFERICDSALIRFPVDHLVLHLTALTEEAIRYNFGPDFVAKHVPPSPHGKQRAVSFGQGKIRTIGGDLIHPLIHPLIQLLTHSLIGTLSYTL